MINRLFLLNIYWIKFDINDYRKNNEKIRSRIGHSSFYFLLTSYLDKKLASRQEEFGRSFSFRQLLLTKSKFMFKWDCTCNKHMFTVGMHGSEIRIVTFVRPQDSLPIKSN